MKTADIITVCVLVVSLVCIFLALRKMFRRPTHLTVTRTDTGKSVVLDTRAGWQEGSKLSALL